MFCPFCGSQCVDGAAFCIKCGKRLPNLETKNNNQATHTEQNINLQNVEKATNKSNVATPAQSPKVASSATTQCIGFSNAVSDDRFKSKLSAQKRASFIFTIILIALPFIGFVIYSLTSKMKMQEAMAIGGGVSGLFALFCIFSYLKQCFSSSWEGVVISKEVEKRRKRKHDYHTHNVYIVNIQTDAGKIRQIENPASDSYYYSYFNVGDRVKYHHNLEYYEKYDKSHDTHLLCPFCGSLNPITDELCKCGSPIIK